jgi:glycosyltransferase involved in cell wall biosynthesis
MINKLSYRDGDVIVGDKLVNVLLATYNGERFLEEQLDSIYRQSYQHLRLLVRDDGSTDDTLTILEREQNKGLLSLITSNQNLGPANNFFTLLKYSDSNATYFSFSDQDDIWKEDKLRRAIEKLESVEDGVPAIYCSAVEYANNSGQLIKQSRKLNQITFGNALVENVITGCTIVMNRSAKELIVKHVPEKCVMHDAWCYLVVVCFGKIIYDESPGLRYRQHDRNVFGAATTSLDLFGNRIRRFINSSALSYHEQAESFLKLFPNQIPDKKLNLLKRYVYSKYSIYQRLILLFDKEIIRQSKIDTLLLKILILFNKH